MANLAPNSTQCPNVILDAWLPYLNLGELKIVLYLVRRTFGFQRQACAVSLGQICAGTKAKDGRALDLGTGLTRRAAAAAVARLVKRGLVLRAQQTAGNGFATSIYALNLNWQAPTEGSAPGSTTQRNGEATKKPGSAPGSTRPVSAKHEMTDQVALGESPHTSVCSASGSARSSAPGSATSSPPKNPLGNKGKEQQQQGPAVVVVPPSEKSTSTSTASALAHELIARGMGRRIAVALALRHSDECRRQLDYLAAMSPPPKNPAGWLRRAIEEGFGPPPTPTPKKRAIVYLPTEEAVVDKEAEIPMPKEFLSLPVEEQRRFFSLDDARKDRPQSGWRKKLWDIQRPLRIAAWMKDREKAAKTTCPEDPCSTQATSSDLGASSSQLHQNEFLLSAHTLRASAEQAEQKEA